MDIDFLLRRIQNSPETVRNVVSSILQMDTGNSFVTYEISEVAPIALTKKYTGVGVHLVARIKNTRTPLQIDFGFGDIIVPGSIKRILPTQLQEYASPCLKTYSLETTIAEKVDAILYLMELSSRMKDYFDIVYLSHHFSFDGSLLCEALSQTFQHRNHLFSIDRFIRILEFASNPLMRSRWNAFSRRVQIESYVFQDILTGLH